jgi:hypothetical protein
MYLSFTDLPTLYLLITSYMMYLSFTDLPTLYLLITSYMMYKLRYIMYEVIKR